MSFMTGLKELLDEACRLDETLAHIESLYTEDPETSAKYMSFIRAFAVKTILGLIERFAIAQGMVFSVHISPPEYGEDFEAEAIYSMDFLMFDVFQTFFDACEDVVQITSFNNPLNQEFYEIEPYLKDYRSIAEMVHALPFKDKRLYELSDLELEQFITAYACDLKKENTYSEPNMEVCDDLHAKFQAEKVIEALKSSVPYAKVEDSAELISSCTFAAAEIENAENLVCFWSLDFSSFFSSDLSKTFLQEMRGILEDVLKEQVCDDETEQYVFYDGDCRVTTEFYTGFSYEYGNFPAVTSFRISMQLIALVGAMHVARNRCDLK